MDERSKDRSKRCVHRTDRCEVELRFNTWRCLICGRYERHNRAATRNRLPTRPSQMATLPEGDRRASLEIIMSISFSPHTHRAHGTHTHHTSHFTHHSTHHSTHHTTTQNIQNTNTPPYHTQTPTRTQEKERDIVRPTQTDRHRHTHHCFRSETECQACFHPLGPHDICADSGNLASCFSFLLREICTVNEKQACFSL